MTFTTPYNPVLISQVLNSLFRKSHVGIKKQKGRSDVAGSNRKPWPQKGKGKARAGTLKSPLFRGGGKTFAASGIPKRQHKINKKSLHTAFSSLLSFIWNKQNICHAIDLNQFIAINKTKVFLQKIQSLCPNLNPKKRNLILLSEEEMTNVALHRATANLYYIHLSSAKSLDMMTLYKADRILYSSYGYHELCERVKDYDSKNNN